MCGIIGCAGLLLPVHEKAFRDLLVFDSIRGEDSTGVLSVAGNGEAITSKVVGDPFELFRYHPYVESMKRNNKVLIGHNRWATVGGVSKRTAHPFTAGPITGVHNGTLTNKYQLHDGVKYAVDSEALYNHMNSKGLHSLLNTMTGAWCLVWWDADENTLNFLRNKERPLYMAIATDSNTVFWASEKWMLEIALSRNKIAVGAIEQIPEDVHLSFEVNMKRELSKPIARPAPSTVPVIQHNVVQYQKKTQDTTTTTPSATNTSRETGYKSLRKGVRLFGGSVEKDGFGGEYLDCIDVTQQQLTLRLYRNSMVNIQSLEGEEFIGDIGTMCSTITEGVYFKIVPFSVTLVEKHYRGNNNKLLTKAEWEAEHPNCDFCTAPLKAENKNRMTSKGQCLCPGCAEDPEITQYVTLN